MSLARHSDSERRVQAAADSCGGVRNPAFDALLGFWDATVENTAAVFGLSGDRDMVDAEEASRAHHAAAAAAPRREPSVLRQRRAGGERVRASRSRRSDAKAATPAEADSPSSPRGPTAARTSVASLADSAISTPVDANGKATRRSDYDDDEPRLAVPGLEYLRRLYAPRKLLKAYEELEARVKTREFRHAPREEQEAVLAEMATVKQRIELRDNRLNHLSSLGGSLHGVYVGIMATMLSVFVAQTCPGATDASGAAIPGTHTCSISEAAARGGDMQLFVLAFNAFTLFMVALTEVQILRRENWMDDALSYDPDQSANHLLADPEDSPDAPVLRNHPYIAHTLMWQNLVVGNLARATIVAVIINLVLTSALLLGQHSAGNSTVIGLVTNTMLLGSKLLHAASVCLQKQNALRAVSIYKATRVVFNVIDTSFLSSPHYLAIVDDLANTRFNWAAVEAEMDYAAAAEHGNLDALRNQAREVLAHMAIGAHNRKRIGRISSQENMTDEEWMREMSRHGGSVADGAASDAEAGRASSKGTPRSSPLAAGSGESSGTAARASASKTPRESTTTVPPGDL